jgi:hypothetical protein
MMSTILTWEVLCVEMERVWGLFSIVIMLPLDIIVTPSGEIHQLKMDLLLLDQPLPSIPTIQFIYWWGRGYATTTRGDDTPSLCTLPMDLIADAEKSAFWRLP